MDDTSIEARRTMTLLYAQMTPAEKIGRMRELTLAANGLALAGLRVRHPNDSEPELLVRLARIRLGNEIVNAVYGSASAGRGA